MANLKNQAHEALSLWGKAFDEIPKSAFAVVAWHLANANSGRCDHEGAAVQAFRDEAKILAEQNILPISHWNAIKKALPAA